jgi:hypothetical protein
MIEANEYIFGELENYVRERGYEGPLHSGRRHLKTNDDEKNWLKNLRIEEQKQVSINSRAAKFLFKRREYFVFVGWERLPVDDTILLHLDLNAGLATALISELRIPILADTDPLVIVENIFFQIRKDGYTKEDLKNWEYSFEDVIQYFETFTVYEVPQESILHEAQLDRLSGFYISQGKQNLPLSFSKDTIDVFERVFLEGATVIPYGNLRISLTTSDWEYAFLDAYQCIERLFPLHALKELHQKTESPISLFDFAVYMEDILSWRANENDTVDDLISEGVPKEVERLLRLVMKKIDGNSKGRLGNRFYRIRNSIVHYRPATKPILLKDQDWDTLIRATLLLILHWYDKYRQKFTFGEIG